jgi:DeoR/GlpR family transcriptional regulator of sugar metabolism
MPPGHEGSRLRPSRAARGESLLVTQRHRLILDSIAEQGTIETADLARALQVSEMTVRRDLAELDRQGLLVRVRGGAQTILDADVGYPHRARRHPDEKRQIGTAAAAQVNSHDTIFLDAGSTTVELARALRRRSGLRRVNVVTNAVNLAAELSGSENIIVIQVGGEIYRETFSCTGPIALEAIERFSFDRMFLAAQGVHPDDGLTNSNLLEVQVKVAAMGRSNWTCLIADASKWESRSMYRITDLGGIDAWVSDSRLAEKARAAARDRGVEVIVAEEF